MNPRLKSPLQQLHVKLSSDFPGLVRQCFRAFAIAPPAAAPEQQRILSFGVGEPWTRPDALIHLERMLEMRLRLIELAERRGEHSEKPAGGAVTHRNDSGGDRHVPVA